VLKIDTGVLVHTGHVHTRFVLLVGCVHMRDALSIGRIPVDRLIYVEDFFLISVGVEGVS
jgi:hypothetical protein